MSKWVMFGAFSWFIATMLSAFMSASYIGASQRVVFDRLMLFTIWHIGRIPIPMINLSFFDGIWSTLQTGNFYFLQDSPLFAIVYLFNIGIVVGFLTLFSALVTSFIRR
mgnify:CR=1 FL=1